MLFLKQVFLSMRTPKEVYHLSLDGRKLIEATGKKSLNDEFEMFPKGNVKEVGKKIIKMEGISNFTLISNNDKGEIN